MCKSKPQSFVSHSRATDDENVINEIIQYNNDHPSIIKIRENLGCTQISEDFKLKQATESDINKLLKNLDSKKMDKHRQNPS